MIAPAVAANGFPLVGYCKLRLSAVGRGALQTSCKLSSVRGGEQGDACCYVGRLDTYLITHVILSAKNTKLLLLLLGQEVEGANTLAGDFASKYPERQVQDDTDAVVSCVVLFARSQLTSHAHRLTQRAQQINEEGRV